MPNREPMKQAQAMAIFRHAREHVPAYRSFLRAEGISERKARLITDIRDVPKTTKKNYILPYPVELRMAKGSLTKTNIIASSSGTTGNPLYWPRGSEANKDAVAYHEYIFQKLFGMSHERSTLAIIAFPMGVYTSGIATTLPLFDIAKRFPLTVVTAGLNRDGIIDVAARYAGQFDQVILIGHPFFIKDVLETGAKRVNWKKCHTKLMMCSEGFTEEWRTYVMGLIGTKDPAHVLNTYGSSEMLLMATETPLSIAIRRKAVHSPRIREALFPSEAHPHNLFQYDPKRHFIESVEGALLFTSGMEMPFVRYQIGDEGRIFSFEEAAALAGQKVGVHRDKMPFVSLRGRLDHTITFHGINMYPEHFHHALNTKTILKHLTGKFVLERVVDKHLSPVLQVVIELRQEAKSSLSLVRNLTKLIKATLEKESIEYRFLLTHVGGELTPRVLLKPYQDSEYFKVGVKPKYIR